MSMSTNISDLPGPTEDNESHESFEDTRDTRDTRDTQDMDREYDEPRTRRQFSQDASYEQPSRIKMDIKKVNRQHNSENQSIFSIIKREINEENLLILFVLYVASTSLIDDYVRKFLIAMSFNTSSLFIFKCVVLLIVFILSKNYLLPYIRV